MTKALDLVGMKFGKLRVIKRIENNKNNLSQWLCQCACGQYIKVIGSKLKFGHTKSCGCIKNYKVRQINLTHGMSHTREYRIWLGIKKRCLNSHSKDYNRYGGKGITICDRWNNNFLNFIKDMGNCPEGYSIDRIDNSKGYQPDNCRWANDEIQRNNKTVNHYLTYKGKTLTIAQWARELNLTDSAIRHRLKRWKDVDKVLFTFPEKQELKLHLVDILDKEVDEKYYLPDSVLTSFIFKNTKNITSDQILQVGNLKIDSKRKNPQVGRVYSPYGIAPTLNTMQGGQREPKVLIKSNTTKGYTEATVGDSLNIAQPSSKTRRGRVGKGVANTLTTQDTMCVIEPSIIVYDDYNSRVRADQTTIGTITTMIGHSSLRHGYKIIENQKGDFKIRKLTPRECFALMGFQKEDADKLSDNGISNTQLYKQAGNSIVVDVLMGIFSNLLYLFNSEYTELKEK